MSKSVRYSSLLNNTSFLTFLASSIVLTTGESASAQTTQGAESREIVVTARKRSETLLDIPLAISAFSEQQIEDANLTNLNDIGVMTPGFDFKSGYSGGRVNETLRFRAMDVRVADPTTQNASLFVDGIYVLGGANSIPFDDVERIEVIKGPQSAYFGRSTFAGAVNYVTKDPSNEFGGKVSLDLATYGSYRGSLSLDIPILPDVLTTRIIIGGHHKSGMYSANDGGRLGEERTQFISGTALFKPTDRLTLKFRGYYSEDEDGAPAIALLSSKSALNAPSLSNCAGQSTTVQTTVGAINATNNFFCGIVPTLKQAQSAYDAFGSGKVISSNTTLTSPNALALVSAGLPDVLKFNTFTPSTLTDILVNNSASIPFIDAAPDLDHIGLKREITRLSLGYDYAFDSGINISGNLAYNESNLIQIRDNDLSDDDVTYVVAPQLLRDYSGELRITSGQDGGFRWLVGANYYNQRVDGNFASGSALVITSFNFNGTNVGIAGPAFIYNEGNKVETKGVFGGISYDINSALTLDVDGRYQSDEVTKFAGASATSLSSATQTFNSFTPRLILNWKPDRDTTIYGSYSRGSLQGLINGFFVPYIGDDAALAVAQTALAPFGAGVSVPAETLDDFEFGIKQSLLDGQLRYSLALYYMQWRNQKFNTFAFLDQATLTALGLGVNAALQNFTVTGASDLWGVEFQGSYQTGNLQFDLSANYAASKIKRGSLSTECSSFIFEGGQTCEQTGFALDVADNKLPQFPTFSGTFAATYSGEINNDWGWYTRGDVAYTGQQYVDYANLVETDDYFTVNLKAGLRREDLTLEFYVNNLLNDDSWAYVSNSRSFDQRFTGTSPSGNLGVTASPTGSSGLAAVPLDKRQFGMRAIFSF